MGESASKNKRYVFIGKTLFFPKERILAVGDLHLGYEGALRSRGLEVPIKQFEEMQEELEKTIKYIRAVYGKIEEVVFLGDIKHHFNFVATEKEEVKKLISFLRKQNIDENKVIFIRGNHERNDKSGKYIDYYLFKDIAFIHGDRDFIEIYDQNINLVVMGHIHPTVTLEDEMKIKKEKYKCFLAGKYKKKEFVIVPSFLKITEGVSLTEFIDEHGHDFSTVPDKDMKEFNVFICQELGEDALNFGKLKELP
jgi:putative SbcD/Mre11-related phosphoesterase